MLAELAETLPDMVLFVAVARAGSLSRAARTLRMPVSTLSRRLTALEARLAVQLLHRTTRRVVPTPAGERYLERCERVIAAAEEAQADLGEEAEAVRGPLRVSTTQDFALTWLVPVLQAFTARHPEVSVELHLTSRPVDLIADGIDVAIRLGPLPDSRLFARRLGAGTQGLYASPGLPGGEPAEPADLARRPCLLLQAPSGRRARWTLTRGEEAVTVEVTGRVVANGMRVLAELASAGLGIALLGDRIADGPVRRGELVRVLPEWSPPAVPCHAITASRAVPARVRAFLRALQEELDLEDREAGPR